MFPSYLSSVQQDLTTAKAAEIMTIKPHRHFLISSKILLIYWKSFHLIYFIDAFELKMLNEVLSDYQKPPTKSKRQKTKQQQKTR